MPTVLLEVSATPTASQQALLAKRAAIGSEHPMGRRHAAHGVMGLQLMGRIRLGCRSRWLSGITSEKPMPRALSLPLIVAAKEISGSAISRGRAHHPMCLQQPADLSQGCGV